MKTSTKSNRPIHSPQRKKAHEILTGKGYICQWSHNLDDGALMEHYAGPKGCVILYTYPSGKDGVNLYADWPLGNDWQKIEEALS